MKIQVCYSIDIDDATIERLYRKALELGYSFDGAETKAKRVSLVRRILIDLGRCGISQDSPPDDEEA